MRCSIHQIRHLIQRDTITTHLMKQLLPSLLSAECPTEQSDLHGHCLSDRWPSILLSVHQLVARTATVAAFLAAHHHCPTCDTVCQSVQSIVATTTSVRAKELLSMALIGSSSLTDRRREKNANQKPCVFSLSAGSTHRITTIKQLMRVLGRSHA